MTIKQILLSMIVGGSVATAILLAQEIVTSIRARKAAAQAARSYDMAMREARITKERIAHNREQLALDYLNRKDVQ